jgi:hypothetical protein
MIFTLVEGAKNLASLAVTVSQQPHCSLPLRGADSAHSTEQPHLLMQSVKTSLIRFRA